MAAEPRRLTFLTVDPRTSDTGPLSPILFTFSGCKGTVAESCFLETIANSDIQQTFVRTVNVPMRCKLNDVHRHIRNIAGVDTSRWRSGYFVDARRVV